jgi:hypothetical protein
MKQISTTALAKSLNIPAKDLFANLVELGFIEKDGESWVLTQEGEKIGGVYKESPQYGKYIVWPEDLTFNQPDTADNKTPQNLLTATAIGQSFEEGSAPDMGSPAGSGLTYLHLLKSA